LLLCGPAINLLFVLLFLLLDYNVIIVYINILIFLFNMIPIYPLDGGRIIKYILHIFLGRKKSLKFTYIISNVTTIILSIFIIYFSIMSKNVAYFFVMVYIWIIVLKENKKYKIKSKMYKILENNIAINSD